MCDPKIMTKVFQITQQAVQISQSGIAHVNVLYTGHADELEIRVHAPIGKGDNAQKPRNQGLDFVHLSDRDALSKLETISKNLSQLAQGASQ